MWTDTAKKWRRDSLEARIYAAAEAESLANDRSAAESASDALEAIFEASSIVLGNTGKDAVDLIKKRWHVKTSTAGVSGFWRRICSPFLEERMRRSSTLARRISGELDSEAVQGALLDQVTAAAFDLMSSPNPDPKAVARYTNLILKADKQSMDRTKLAAATKSKIEIGLDALADAIKGNKAAEKIYAELRKVVANA